MTPDAKDALPWKRRFHWKEVGETYITPDGGQESDEWLVEDYYYEVPEKDLRELLAMKKRVARLEAALEKIIVSTDNWVVEIAQEALREDKP